MKHRWWLDADNKLKRACKNCKMEQTMHIERKDGRVTRRYWVPRRGHCKWMES